MTRAKPFKAHSSVATLSKFIYAVDQIHKSWNKDPNHQFDAWFRGHADASWSLLPSLYRDHAVRDYGETHMDDFKLKAHPYLAGVASEPATDWDWYFLMQHHGLPTRLLDWTEGALLGLYFAVRDSLNTYADASKPPDACVWVLDPWSLNLKVAKKGDRILYPTEKPVRGYLSEATEPPASPIALLATLKSRRIAAQKGVFTLHGAHARGLETYTALRPHLARIDIPWNAIDRIRRSLVRAGITETTVFPELPGLSRELLYYWRDEY